MAISVAVMAATVLLGGWWWNVEAANYAENISDFAPAHTTATLAGNVLDLHVDGSRATSRAARAPTATISRTTAT